MLQNVDVSTILFFNFVFNSAKMMPQSLHADKSKIHIKKKKKKAADKRTFSYISGKKKSSIAGKYKTFGTW
jgi:hypothetical protein